MASGPSLPGALSCRAEPWPAAVETTGTRVQFLGYPAPLHLSQICSALEYGRERISASGVSSARQRGCAMTKAENLENLLLFIMSSSACTLITGVVLLLRPLTALP